MQEELSMWGYGPLDCWSVCILYIIKFKRLRRSSHWEGCSHLMELIYANKMGRISFASGEGTTWCTMDGNGQYIVLSDETFGSRMLEQYHLELESYLNRVEQNNFGYGFCIRSFGASRKLEKQDDVCSSPKTREKTCENFSLNLLWVMSLTAVPVMAYSLTVALKAVIWICSVVQNCTVLYCTDTVRITVSPVWARNSNAPKIWFDMMQSSREKWYLKFIIRHTRKFIQIAGRQR